ncbi:MAG TPA: NAD(P)-dependent oxidoreductase [Bradyrhizobium sp.]|nr:NAD(P)-dependent oxidoreductase [Bradyrhizobium sp.]
MKIFLAGATGVIGRRLAVLLRDKGHAVTGTTRHPEKAPWLQALRIAPCVVDVFDADALAGAVMMAEPDVVIHQLTDLPKQSRAIGSAGYAAGQEANRRLRMEGTRHLVRAAVKARVGRVIAQSVAFVYAPGEGVRDENDPLDVAAEPPRQLTVQGIMALEREVLQSPGITGVVLRYGYFYGPGSWYDAPPKPPSVHVDAAAHAALLAVDKGDGIYNIAEDGGAVSGARAARDLGFDPAFRLSKNLIRELAAPT